MTQSSAPSSDSGRGQMLRRGPMQMSKIEQARDPRRSLRRLVPYFGEHRLLLTTVFALIVVSTLLGLVGPYLMGRAVDQYIDAKRLDGLGTLVLIMLAVFLLGNVADLISAWLMAAVSQRALQRLRQDLLEHLQTLPVRFFDSNPAGELMSRLTNDIDAINTAVSQNVVSLFASVLSMVGILVAMFVLNVWLALASLLVVPLMIWFTNFVARYTRRGFRDLQKGLGQLNGVMEEAISGQRVIKAFRRDQTATANFRTANQEVYRAGVYANTYALLLMPLTNQLGNLFVIVIAGLGGWLALQGLATVGAIVTFISYGRSFINPLRQLANLYNSIQAALAGAERVFEIMDTPSETDEGTLAVPAAAITGHVSFENVDFSYVPGTPIIEAMTLEAAPGSTVALVGPTGAGKTTIVNLLTRFYEIDRGSIRIDGADIRSLRKDNLRQALGLVLQDTFLFSGTVMENIRYGRLDATDQEVVTAAQTADADHFIRQLPQGYQTQLSERAGNLSQGQRQLLAIARAVLADPAILILDEATSSVDTRTELRIQRALLQLLEGRTAFVIAHRLSTIRDADAVVVIRDGRIVEQGRHAELLARRGFYYHLTMSQYKGEAI
ncbi:MAG: ABC transporter ATP-binding protein [Anaerolineae bacterium]